MIRLLSGGGRLALKIESFLDFLVCLSPVVRGRWLSRCCTQRSNTSMCTRGACIAYLVINTQVPGYLCLSVRNVSLGIFPFLLSLLFGWCSRHLPCMNCAVSKPISVLLTWHSRQVLRFLADSTSIRGQGATRRCIPLRPLRASWPASSLVCGPTSSTLPPSLPSRKLVHLRDANQVIIFIIRVTR